VVAAQNVFQVRMLLSLDKTPRFRSQSAAEMLFSGI